MRRISISVLMPSGLDENGYTWKVNDVKNKVLVSFSWSKPFIDARKLQAALIKDVVDVVTTLHPKVAGYEDAIAELRKNPNQKEFVPSLKFNFRLQCSVVLQALTTSFGGMTNHKLLKSTWSYMMILLLRIVNKERDLHKMSLFYPTMLISFRHIHG